MKSAVQKRFFKLTFEAIAATAILVNSNFIDPVLAGSASPHHSFLGGPWEIIVQRRLDEERLRFPLNVSDESKPQKLNSVLPIKGTSIKIKLENYVPDLKWETKAVEHPGGEIALKLHITGRNLKQDIWLCSGDPARQSISSGIGGISIRRLNDVNKAEMLIKGLTDPRAVGVISIWPEEVNKPFEYVAVINKTISIPDSEYKVKTVEYIPHYSIDTKTKEVVNQSQKPVNPAIKVILYDGKKTFERWIWAKFPSSPHKEQELPLHMRFTDFEIGKAKGQYILAAASETKLWLFSYQKDKKIIERAVLSRPYPFADTEYSFSIEKIMDGAIVKTDWTNGSEKLLNPAVIAAIKQDGTNQQAVLELNKPIHYKLKSGMLVLLYRRVQASLR